MTVKILATAQAQPARVVDNDELAAMLNLDSAGLDARLATKTRCYTGNGTTGSDLLARATTEALSAIGRVPADLDGIVASTVTPDHQFPGNAAFTQRALGVSRQAILDIRACDGGVLHSLDAATALIDAGTLRLVALCAVDLLSSGLWLNPTGAGVTEWFGDAAAVWILGEAADNSGIVSLVTGNDPENIELFWQKDPGTYVRPRMSRALVESGEWRLTLDVDGMRDQTLRLMPSACKKALADAGVSAADIAAFIPSTIVPAWGAEVASELGIVVDRMVNGHAGRGYCGTALLPSALDDALKSGRVKTGDLVLAAAVGSGVAFSAMVYRV